MHNDAVQLAGMTLVGNLFPQFVHCIHYQELMNCQGRASLALPDPLRQPVIAYSMNARQEWVWDTTVPRFVLAPPELGWAIIG